MAGKRCAVTDREKLVLQIDLTINFEFGSACDFVDKIHGLTDQQRARLKSEIRTRGNNVKRVVSNHLTHYNVTHRNLTPVNAEKIADRVLQKEG